MQKDTSWQKVAGWYSGITKDGGHYYHQHVVIPGVLRLLNLPEYAQVLDLGCGNGVLAKALPKQIDYLGVDSASSLIETARVADDNPRHKYIVGDVTQPLKTNQKFGHGAIILALQNMKAPLMAIENTSKHIADNGTLVIVLNHPSFRIPRQSSWGVDEATKIQYRKVNKYMSPMEIPITAHPGARQSPITWSYHYPLSSYSEMLYDNGFVIEKIEEWTSDKESVGKAARSENRAREEFPLFMAIKARKIAL
ncbi:MAG: class I SAM-dependent methyltransferase [bacterium]